MRRLCILFFISFAFCKSALALESAGLTIVSIPPAFSLPVTGNTENALSASPANRLAAGEIDIAGFRIPSTQHIALYDSEGNNIPLVIERASLGLAADTITRMRLAFIVPAFLPADATLRLVWSREQALTPKNRELPELLITAQTLTRLCTFQVTPVFADDNTVATVIVEVDPKGGIYQLWYLMPLLVILLLVVLANRIYKVGFHPSPPQGTTRLRGEECDLPASGMSPGHDRMCRGQKRSPGHARGAP
ncbi:hypothetical protein JW933_04030 [candidate division FCPU426 bacterium]|nr:hypothetical protein [candidate division FCPU426 bacterium]